LCGDEDGGLAVYGTEGIVFFIGFGVVVMEGFEVFL
jgi:hypothetical protein